MLGALIYKKVPFTVSAAVSYMLLVLTSTVLVRIGEHNSGVDWTPMRLLRIDGWWSHKDMILQIRANILMFIPVGLLLAPKMGWRAVLIGLLFSLGIEVGQWVLRCGFSELDDVIHNTMGALIGCAIYRVISALSGGRDLVYRKCVKRLLDIVISLIVIVVLSPVYLIAYVAIRLDSKGPAIFRQTRLGKGGKEFTLYKFRSMVVNAEHTGSGVYSGHNDARVTRVGRIIRATSIDELPQAVNMLKGDMSLIGPRPPLTYHPWPIEKYTAEQRHMFDVRPGITGWAQVHGRKDVEWHERIKLNNWYVDHCSFLLDVKIFFKTIAGVLTNADNENVGETVKKKD